MNGGKLKRPITKPRLTTEQVKERLAFSNKWIDKIQQDKDLHICFLDEKWFYTTSRRKKMKILPQADFETDDQAFIPKPKLQSRRFPCKVMFMGLVCPPVKNKTNGKILLKRVSEQKVQKRSSYNKNFVSEYVVNHKLKNGEWKQLYPKDNQNFTVGEFLSLIVDEYGIDNDVAADLVFCYNSFTQVRKTKAINKRLVKLDDHTKPVIGNRKIKYKRKSDESTLGERRVKLKDIELRVNPKSGKLIEKDITCDSDFMMNHIRDIGKSTRATYSFLEETHPVFLFMDNAGGHGKTEVKSEYERILKTEFNVHIVWQVPNSPETNMLDLGVWMALQSKVESIHRGKVMQSNELSKSVHQAFDEISEDVLSRVFERWKMVLHLIRSGKGTNEVIEEHRGKLNRSLLEPDQLPTVPDTVKLDKYEVQDSDSDSDESEVLLVGGQDALERHYDKT